MASTEHFRFGFLSKSEIIYFLTIFCCICCEETVRTKKEKKSKCDSKEFFFPEYFRFGVTSSAFQVEGAWNEDGKGESIWDRYIHRHPEVVADGTNADVASDSYHLYKRDVEMLKQLDADYYRFTFSWSRIFPAGFEGKISEKGLAYYSDLVDELIRNRIEYIAVMYDDDLPRAFQNHGGWTNPRIVSWFETYARLLFMAFPSVMYWVTINNPAVCFAMYSGAKVAPGIDARGVADYMCVRNMLLAHANVYRMFKREFAHQNFTQYIGISVRLDWPVLFNGTESNAKSKRMNDAKRNSVDPKLVETTDLVKEFTLDLYLHPLFSERGGFPEAVKAAVAKNSKEEGLVDSRLPRLTKDEKKLLKNAADFLGINFYTAYYVHMPKEGKLATDYRFPKDVNFETSMDEDWRPAKTPFVSATGFAFYQLWYYIKHKYKNIPLVLTESGYSTDKGLEDYDRIDALNELLRGLCTSVTYGANIRAAMISKLMDGFEYSGGLTTQRFGLFEVDFDSPNKTRVPRASAYFFRSIIDKRRIPSLKGWRPDDISLTPSTRRGEPLKTMDS